MRNYMNVLCTILFYVCSSHAQTPLNDISGTNTIYSASEVDYRIESRVPTNRTITIGSQVGSLQTNLVFTSTGAGVTEPTVTNIAQAVVDANVPTLAEVANSGGFAGTETISPLNISLGGYFQSLGGAISGTIDQSSFGASQSGVNDGVMSIGVTAFGASQIGQNEGTRIIADSAVGSSQIGNNYGIQEVGRSAFGASQRGLNDGVMSIGVTAFGASQIGSTSSFSTATNNAIGALQFFELSNGQHALTTPEGSASLLLGAGTISNKNSIVVGDGEYSHGQGSVTAGGGFFGSGLGITIYGTYIQDAINQRVEKSNGTATNLSVFSSLTLLDKTITWNSSRQTFDVPLYGGVVGQLFQENLMLVRNQTGANIGNGKIVCSAGSVGDNSAIRKASNADASCAWGVLGMVTQDAGIDHGSDGLICTGGEVNNLPLPTSVYQPSNTLWLATDGNYTNVEPQNVAVKYQIGIVLRAHATEGRIQFHPQFIPSPASIGALPTSHNTDETAHPGLRSIVKPIVFGTNVVRVVSTQSVYVATVTSPCVITQDVSALTLATNQTAFWTTRINVTGWSATNGITFATNIAAYAGDFTVTGCYDFACSLLCDGRVEMRQTFPTRYEWVSFPAYVANGNTPDQPRYWNEVVKAGFTNNFAMLCCHYDFKEPCLLKMYWNTYVANGETNPISVFVGMGLASSLPNTVAKVTVSTDFFLARGSIGSNNTRTFFVGSITPPNFTYCNPYIEFSSPYTGPRAFIYKMATKKANELEIKAYNNGWRPQ